MSPNWRMPLGSSLSHCGTPTAQYRSKECSSGCHSRFPCWPVVLVPALSLGTSCSSRATPADQVSRCTPTHGRVHSCRAGSMLGSAYSPPMLIDLCAIPRLCSDANILQAAARPGAAAFVGRWTHVCLCSALGVRLVALQRYAMVPALCRPRAAESSLSLCCMTWCVRLPMAPSLP